MKPQIKNALENGIEHKVAGSTYMGSNPEYREIDFGSRKEYTKTKPGIPWVKV